MTMELFVLAREGFLAGDLDWDAHTMKVALLNLDVADAGVKAITGATNATPIVITATAHGFAAGDTVVISGVGGNTAANNIWKIKNTAANTFELADRNDGTTNSVGNGAYTSGGVAVCLGPSAAGDNWDDFSACLVGTAQTLTSKTVVAGVADAADVSVPAVTGPTVEAVTFHRDTGVESTSRMVWYYDGKHLVTCAATAAVSATSLPVEALAAPIANGTVLVFSNGASATLTAAAAIGDRVLTVSALAAQITAGKYASATIEGTVVPITPNGGAINLTFAATGIFAL